MSTISGIIFRAGAESRRLKFCAPSLTIMTTLSMVLLSGCDNSPLRSNTSDRDRIEALESSLAQAKLTLGEQQAAITRLQDDNKLLSDWIKAQGASLDSLRKTVNHNADAANVNSAKEMTRNGACGTEYVPGPDGAYVLVNKKCGNSDLSN